MDICEKILYASEAIGLNPEREEAVDGGIRPSARRYNNENVKSDLSVKFISKNIYSQN
jgi:hypothetical protein